MLFVAGKHLNLFDFFYPVLFNRQATLKLQAIEQNHDALVRLQLSLNYADECFQWSIFDPDLVAGFQRVAYLHEAIGVDACLQKCNHFVINGCRLVVETHHSLNSAGIGDFVKRTGGAEARKYVSRKQRFPHLRRNARKLISSVFFDLGVETLNAPGVQVVVCTVLLFCIGADRKP